jgi:hypothetical protein
VRDSRILLGPTSSTRVVEDEPALGPLPVDGYSGWEPLSSPEQTVSPRGASRSFSRERPRSLSPKPGLGGCPTAEPRFGGGPVTRARLALPRARERERVYARAVAMCERVFRRAVDSPGNTIRCLLARPDGLAESPSSRPRLRRPQLLPVEAGRTNSRLTSESSEPFRKKALTLLLGQEGSVPPAHSVEGL